IQGRETLGGEDGETERSGMIRDYFSRVENEISRVPMVIEVSFDTTVIDTDLGYWKATLTFRDGSELHMFEFVAGNGELEVDKYRYHMQDYAHDLLFRYDDAAHHPEIDTYPDHKHLPDGVNPSQKPSLEQVLDEAVEKVAL
ncbi:MAG: DUF6516 family protein, partial [Candidatus Nanohaloarchaea archaeon]|nr:DUF6516 family protein [Candidatus Nanohaloarchaea archaeon]